MGEHEVRPYDMKRFVGANLVFAPNMDNFIFEPCQIRHC